MRRPGDSAMTGDALGSASLDARGGDAVAAEMSTLTIGLAGGDGEDTTGRRGVFFGGVEGAFGGGGSGSGGASLSTGSTCASGLPWNTAGLRSTSFVILGSSSAGGGVGGEGGLAAALASAIPLTKLAASSLFKLSSPTSSASSSAVTMTPSNPNSPNVSVRSISPIASLASCLTTLERSIGCVPGSSSRMSIDHEGCLIED